MYNLFCSYLGICDYADFTREGNVSLAHLVQCQGNLKLN